MSERKAYIVGISDYLPEKTYTNEDLAQDYLNWTSDSILKKIGIKQRHIAAEDEYVSDLAVKACENLFLELDFFEKKNIDFIILCTQSPDFTIPTTACIIQDRLQLPRGIGAFDFNLGCSGFVYGLGIAKGLILSSQADNVLLIMADIYSKRIDRNDYKNRALFGDASTASIISSSPIGLKAEILNFSYGTDGSGYFNLIHFNSGNLFLNKAKKFSEYEKKYADEDNFIFMDGQAIFDFSLTHVPELIERTLMKNDLLKTDVSIYVLHQANSFMLNAIRRKSLISKEKFFVSMENVGNTVSSSIPIALIDAHKTGVIKSGDNVLVAGFGVGLSLAGCILKYVDK